jgi:arylsulfatase A
MNVLLVVLDSVRAANCSLLGSRRETTPTLSRLAREATVYEQARAPSNWSLPSHVSLFTGLETHVHGVTVHRRLEPGHTVFERLAADGYDTGLFTENGFLAAHEVGLKDAFETVETVPAETPDAYATGEVNDGPDGFYYADRLREWLDAREGPWAACLNLMDAHRPFEPRPAFDRWGDDDARRLQSSLDLRWEPQFHGDAVPDWQLAGLETLYDGGIRQADAVLDRVVADLRERGALDDTLLVVCGDHGDGFGEPGYLSGEPPAVSHIVPMHETLLHVPLVVRPPGGGPGERVAAPATLTRFPDAVAAARRGERPSFVPDGPVVAAKQPVTADLRRRFERACGDPEPLFAASRAVYEPSGDGVVKTYHWGEAAGRLRVPAAGATVPVGGAGGATDADCHDRVERVFDRFEPRNVAGPRPDERVDEDAKERLRALGYY